MKSRQAKRSIVAKVAGIALVAAVLVLSAGCGHLMSHWMGMSDAHRPADSEFGAGPRTSAQHLYVATLKPEEPLRPRHLTKVPVTIVDAQGRPVDNAVIAVDGGMPEHGHGLPTQPRVTRALGSGAYEIEGLRFNMGGWWELKLAIQSPTGVDNVTFNLLL